MNSRVHIIGAGLAGLSAALRLIAGGCAVTLYEAGPAAGGRCRSYLDRELGIRVDNGNHLLLSGNADAMDFLDRTGARGALGGPGKPVFPFMDLATGARWRVRPNRGRLPWWIFAPGRRVPGTGIADYLRLLALTRVTDDRTVATILPPGPLYRLLVEPLAIAALNTPPLEGLARLLGAVIRETLMRGGGACIPCFPAQGLSEALIDPALGWLEQRGATVHLSHRIAALDLGAGGVAGLQGPDGRIALAAGDKVVLAVPPWVAAGLLPGLTTPDAYEAIVNLHYRLDHAAEQRARLALGAAGFVGLVGGTAEWVFVKPGHASVTISAANAIVDQPAEWLAETVWPDVRAALDLDIAMPKWRVVKERRATFAATAAQERRRPAARTDVQNLVLAGDWTATGLPATIEGAIRSGRIAAELLLAD